MTQVQGPPPGTTLVEDAPVAKASARGKGGGGKAPKVKMGPKRWFREVGWRHLVGITVTISDNNDNLIYP